MLNALEQLQQDYMQRLNEWESAFVELQKMFSLTQRDNAMLNERVIDRKSTRKCFRLRNEIGRAHV
nr:MbeD family mobilization/exclusion protein [Escherichia coli]